MRNQGTISRIHVHLLTRPMGGATHEVRFMLEADPKQYTAKFGHDQYAMYWPVTLAKVGDRIEFDIGGQSLLKWSNYSFEADQAPAK
jgi:hypothetical protein